MTETAEKQTVQCPIHKREFPLATCLARQKIIATKPTSGLKGEAYNRFKLSCGVCDVGSKLYLEVDEIAEKEADIFFSKVPIKIKKIRINKKHNQESKLCQKDYPSIESQDGYECFKICARPQCEKRFVMKPTESTHAFVARKYCCDECAKSADRERDNARKRRERAHRTKAMVFDCGMAKRIAEKLVNENSDVFDVVTDNGAQNLLIKKIITNICIDAQRASHEALWSV